MNDRYLFKAKRKNWKQLPKEMWWVEGYLYGIWERRYILWGMINDVPNMVEVDPSTICQCTGLKDKNGKLIWENDVLSISKKMDSMGNYYLPHVKYPTNVFVKWDLCAWLWETISKNKKDKYYIGFPDAWCHYEAEVIGNIFEEELNG